MDMKLYFFIGIGIKGMPVAGFIAAGDKGQAIVKLSKRLKHTFLVLGIMRFLVKNERKAKSRDLGFFFEKLALLIGAGVPVFKALEIIKIDSGVSGRYAKKIYECARMGDTIYVSMKKHEDIFPDMACNIVGSGEKSGNIEHSFKILQKYYSELDKIKKELISISIYPAIVLVFSMFTFMSIQLIILPKFSELTYSSGVEINGFAQKMLSCSLYIRENVYHMAGLAVLGVAILVAALKSRKVHLMLEKFILKFSYAGDIYKSIAALFFSRTMEMTMKSGMNILECVSSCKGMLKGIEYSRTIDQIEKRISEGDSFNSGIAGSVIFPREFKSLLASAEKTGSMCEIFENMSEFYEKKLGIEVKKIANALGPALIIVVSAMAGSMVYFILVPIMSGIGGVL